MIKNTVDYKIIKRNITNSTIYILIILLILGVSFFIKKNNITILFALFILLVPQIINVIENIIKLNYLYSIRDFKVLECKFESSDYKLKSIYRHRYFKKVYSLQVNCINNEEILLLKSDYIYSLKENKKKNFKDINKYVNKKGKILYSKEHDKSLILINKSFTSNK